MCGFVFVCPTVCFVVFDVGFFCVAWVCWVVVFSAVEPFVEQFEMFSPRGPPTVFAFFGHQRCVFLGCWGVLPFCGSAAGGVGGGGVGGVGGVAGLLDLVGAAV